MPEEFDDPPPYDEPEDEIDEDLPDNQEVFISVSAGRYERVQMSACVLIDWDKEKIPSAKLSKVVNALRNAIPLTEIRSNDEKMSKELLMDEDGEIKVKSKGMQTFDNARHRLQDGKKKDE